MSHFHSKTKRAWLIVAKVAVGLLAIGVATIVVLTLQLPTGVTGKGTGGGAAHVNK